MAYFKANVIELLNILKCPIFCMNQLIWIMNSIFFLIFVNSSSIRMIEKPGPETNNA